MRAFVDASVLVAVLGDEADGLDWLCTMGTADTLLTSPIALWEAVRAVARVTDTAIDQAFSVANSFCLELGIESIGIRNDEARTALAAHAEYGKGNHPAQLNMGDCFAYACAKTNNARLLYKGDDFAKTDLA